MIKKFQSFSFQVKLTLTYLLFTFIALTIFCVLYFINLSSMMTSSLSYITQVNEQANMTLDLALGSETSPNLLHLIDNDVNLILRQKNSEKSQEQLYSDESKMQKCLLLLSLTQEYVLRSSIITQNQDIYSSSSEELDRAYQASMWEYCSALSWSDNTVPQYTPVYLDTSRQTPSLVVTAIYRLYQSGNKSVGYLLMDLDFSQIIQTLNTQFAPSSSTSSMAILSDEEVLYNSLGASISLSEELSSEEFSSLLLEIKADISQGVQSKSGSLAHTPCLLSVLQNENTGWYIIQYLPKNQVIWNSVQRMIGVAIFLLILLVLTSVICFLFSRRISRPVKRLSRIMANADMGIISPYTGADEKRTDEIGNLIRSYNNMGERLNTSLNKNYIYQLNQARTELKLLQFQINPHFLYNSLHTISSIAKLYDVDYISQIAEGLSDLFRYNIKGGEFVKLREELIQIQNYISIQSIRFSGTFQTEYEVDEELKELTILKFILQPLVENSIDHGFADRRKDYLLRISVRRKDGCLYLQVWDNGTGISKEEAAGLNERLANTKANTLLGEQETSIGLTNVNARIKNYYGEDCGLTIESIFKEFTCVTVKLKIEDTLPVYDTRSDKK